MNARKVMNVVVEHLTPNQSVSSAWKAIKKNKVAALPVLHEDNVVGLLTKNDIFEAGPQVLFDNATVSDVMRKEYQLISESAAISEVWGMHDELFLVVDKNERITGIIDKKSVGSIFFNTATRMLLQVEAILESAHNGIIAVDENGIVTIFNKAAEKITRRPKKQAIGKHLSEVIIPQDLLDILKEGRKQLHHKFKVDYSKGSHIYLTNRTPIMENGKIVGAVGVFQDISEFEFISKELDSVKELNKELECIIESSFDGILITDKNGVILEANRAHQRMTGVTDVKGKTMKELVKKNIYSVSIIEAVLEKGGPVTYMEKTRNGSRLLVTGNPVENEKGYVQRVVVNIRDITKLSRLQEELQNSRELTKGYMMELTQLQDRLFKGQELVFRSAKMKQLINVALRVANVDSTVLLLGESGSGKGVIAKVIHANSKRKKGPFVTIDCGAIPENLLESELFGYEQGAFTGASRDGKIGLFELANDGTLFLDEIGDLPLPFQVKILRAIQEREILRVGGSKLRPINVRIIAATNHNLDKLVSEGKFREDLYFRLNVVPLKVSPLRERNKDIIPLIYMFKRKFSDSYGIEKDFAPAVIDVLLDYKWPGNVRELENIIERLLVTAPENLVTLSDLPDYLSRKTYTEFPEVKVGGIMPLRKAVQEVERQLLGEAVKRYGSTYKAAKFLEVDQSTVVRKINRLKQKGMYVN